MELERWTDERLLCCPSSAGAGRSFEAFYLRHERLIAAYHLRRAPDPETAADLTAETFARALGARERFEPRGEGSAVRWLYGIAANVRAMAARSARIELDKTRELGIVRQGLDDLQREALAELATEAGVLRALELIDEDQRAAIRARILDGHSYAQAAADAGASEATIRKRVSRGIAALRRATQEPS